MQGRQKFLPASQVYVDSQDGNEEPHELGPVSLAGEMQ